VVDILVNLDPPPPVQDVNGLLGGEDELHLCLMFAPSMFHVCSIYV